MSGCYVVSRYRNLTNANHIRWAQCYMAVLHARELQAGYIHMLGTYSQAVIYQLTRVAI